MPEKNELAKKTSFDLAKPVGRWGTLQSLLESPQLQAEMAKVVTGAMKPERLARLALTAMKTAEQAEKFLRCTMQSVATAMMDMAQTGLDPTPALGQCCLIPYGDQCTFQAEYRGFITLAMNSGKVAYITADKVREGDTFDWIRGTEQYLRHRPEAPANAPVTHYYAVVKFKDGSSDFRVMTRQEVEKHRDQYSKLPQGPAWKKSFDSMALKTVIRVLCKLLPLSAQMIAATLLDEYREAGVRDVPVEVLGGKPPALEEGSFSFGKQAFQQKPAEQPEEPADEPEPAAKAPEPEKEEIAPPEPPQEQEQAPEEELPPVDDTPDPLDGNAIVSPKQRLIAQITEIIESRDLDVAAVKHYIRSTFKKPSSATCSVKQLADLLQMLITQPELFAKEV